MKVLKRQFSQQCCFMLLGPMNIKAVRKMLMKITSQDLFRENIMFVVNLRFTQIMTFPCCLPQEVEQSDFCVNQH
jgi:hypothetical protein